MKFAATWSIANFLTKLHRFKIIPHKIIQLQKYPCLCRCLDDNIGTSNLFQKSFNDFVNAILIGTKFLVALSYGRLFHVFFSRHFQVQILKYVKKQKMKWSSKRFTTKINVLL